MQDQLTTFRVSPAYLQCLWQQAAFGGAGILVGWGLFLAISLWLIPSIPVSELCRLPIRLYSDYRLWMLPNSEEVRELIRFGIGPGLGFCALLGGLADISSWRSVRYEMHADTLRMCWRGLWRQISWDLIQTVDERTHARTILRSLKINQGGSGVILVRGLEEMPAFVQSLRTHLPRLAQWTECASQIDLTGRLTNFVFGLLLLLPIGATWIAYYVVGTNAIGLVWAVALIPVAFWIWFQQPMSRAHMAFPELEIVLAILLLILSGALTGLRWLEFSAPIPSFVLRWLDW